MTVGLDSSLKDGRYRVTHYVCTGQSGINLHQIMYTTWVAKDIQTNRFQCIRVWDHEFSELMGSRIDVLMALADRSSEYPGSRNVRSTLDHFWAEGHEASTLCTVHPLHRPTLMWLSENSPREEPWPTPMLKSLFRQALARLNFIHQRGVCQGGTV